MRILTPPDLVKIEEYLHTRHPTLFKNIHMRATDDIIIATVYDSDIDKKAGKGKTSQRQLNYLKKIIRDRFFADIEFLILEGLHHEKLEAELNAFLMEFFPDNVKTFFLSFFRPQQADAWIEVVGFSESSRAEATVTLQPPQKKASTMVVKRPPHEKPTQAQKNEVMKINTSGISEPSRNEVMKIIENKVRQFLDLYGINLRYVHWSGIEIKPISFIAILRVIKISSPVNESEISAMLTKKGYSLPQPPWLYKKLEILRNRKLVVRNRNGSYALTTMGLGFVPHNRERSSSDIERALALGRKKW
ncbi:MAG: hypothetical protein HQK96_16505 [Nitrospirae bacterium]|nr:hypothetical protein [Nitrospirota bacterium]